MIIDRKFKKNVYKYLWQCLLAAVIIFIISVVLDMMLQTTTIASIGATVFILYTMPHTRRSRARYVLGGYTIGVVTGGVCYLLSTIINGNSHNLLMAVAVGVAILLMSMTNTEHPPAAGLAIGIVMEGLDLYTVVVIYISISIAIVGKKLLSRWMIDLV